MISDAERQAHFQRLHDEQVASAEASQARKEHMSSMATAKAVASNVRPSSADVEQEERAEAMRRAARESQARQNDDAKFLMSLVGSARAYAVVDHQQREREERRRGKSAEEQRLNAEIERERVRKLEEEQRKERERERKGRQGGDALRRQMEERRVERALAEEARWEEGKRVIRESERAREQEERERVARAQERSERLRRDMETSQRDKEWKRARESAREQAETDAMMTFQREKAIAEEERERAEAQAKRERERVHAQMHAQGERTLLSNARRDALLVRRALEAEEVIISFVSFFVRLWY